MMDKNLETENNTERKVTIYNNGQTDNKQLWIERQLYKCRKFRQEKEVINGY